MYEWNELEEAVKQLKKAFDAIGEPVPRLADILQKMAEIASETQHIFEPNKKTREKPGRITARFIRDIRLRAGRREKSKWETRRICRKF